MLVLTRKTEQKIRIGKHIFITVLKVQGDQVSIGIEAPKDLPIVRGELIFDELRQTAAGSNKKSVLADKKTNLSQKPACDEL